MNGVIERWGWEMASLLAGIAYLVFLFPLCFVFRNKPEDMGLLPDGDTSPPAVAGRGAAARRRGIARLHGAGGPAHQRLLAV